MKSVFTILFKTHCSALGRLVLPAVFITVMMVGFSSLATAASNETVATILNPNNGAFTSTTLVAGKQSVSGLQLPFDGVPVAIGAGIHPHFISISILEVVTPATANRHVVGSRIGLQ